jgi:replication factor C subunit 1
MIRLRAKSLTYDQVKSGGMSTAKDLEMSPFEAARKLLTFEAENLSLTDQMELVFQDFDLVPLLVQENYLNHRPKLGQNDAQRLRIIAKAADGFSAGDVATRSIRRDQNWGIMPFAGGRGTAVFCI